MQSAKHFVFTVFHGEIHVVYRNLRNRLKVVVVKKSVFSLFNNSKLPESNST